jgi:hypothetical protein
MEAINQLMFKAKYLEIDFRSRFSKNKEEIIKEIAPYYSAINRLAFGMPENFEFKTFKSKQDLNP